MGEKPFLSNQTVAKTIKYYCYFNKLFFKSKIEKKIPIFHS